MMPKHSNAASISIETGSWPMRRAVNIFAVVMETWTVLTCHLLGSEFLHSACMREYDELWGGLLTLIPATFYGTPSVAQLEVKECSSRLWASEAVVGSVLVGGAQVWERLFWVSFQ